MQLDPQQKSVYSEAYARWRRDVDALHKVLLDGEALNPPHFVALLRRESKSKARYDEAREQVLGLPGEEEPDDPFAESNNG